MPSPIFPSDHRIGARASPDPLLALPPERVRIIAEPLPGRRSTTQDPLSMHSTGTTTRSAMCVPVKNVPMAKGNNHSTPSAEGLGVGHAARTGDSPTTETNGG